MICWNGMALVALFFRPAAGAALSVLSITWKLSKPFHRRHKYASASTDAHGSHRSQRWRHPGAVATASTTICSVCATWCATSASFRISLRHSRDPTTAGFAINHVQRAHPGLATLLAFDNRSHRRPLVTSCVCIVALVGRQGSLRAVPPAGALL